MLRRVILIEDGNEDQRWILIKVVINELNLEIVW
jgi:hypothetical protein